MGGLRLKLRRPQVHLPLVDRSELHEGLREEAPTAVVRGGAQAGEGDRGAGEKALPAGAVLLVVRPHGGEARLPPDLPGKAWVGVGDLAGPAGLGSPVAEPEHVHLVGRGRPELAGGADDERHGGEDTAFWYDGLVHDLDPDDKPQSLRGALDPLRGVPPPGRWVLWHGPQALAVLRLAEEQGREATTEERAAVQLPEGMPPPLEEFAPAWVLETEAGRWLVRRDDGGAGYVSAYVGGLAVE